MAQVSCCEVDVCIEIIALGIRQDTITSGFSEGDEIGCVLYEGVAVGYVSRQGRKGVSGHEQWQAIGGIRTIEADIFAVG